jgi:hypothetical protein
MKKQKSKSSKREAYRAAEKPSPLRSALIGTMLNMAATNATFGAVLLCLIAAKRFI